MKQKKALVITAAVSSLALVGGVSAYQLYPRQADVAPLVDVVTVEEEKPVEETPIKTEEVTNPTPLPASEPVMPQATEQAPVAILSVQEYGLKYLDLSTPLYQKCFDRIVNYYPNRFMPEVREQNIKALRAFADLCATGVVNSTVEQSYRNGSPSLNGAIIDAYGPGGAFFDSDLAKSRH